MARSVKQKLWFFFDFNRNTNELAQANYPAPSTRTRLGSEANIHERKKLFLVKGTWQPLSNSRFSYTFNNQDRWMRPSNPGAKFRFDERAWRKQFWKPKTHSAQWTSVIGDSMIFDAQWGWLKVNEDNTFPFGSYDPSEVHGYEDRGPDIAYGTWNQLRGRFDGRDHWDIRSNFSYFKKDLAGDHDFKFGFPPSEVLEPTMAGDPGRIPTVSGQRLGLLFTRLARCRTRSVSTSSQPTRRTSIGSSRFMLRTPGAFPAT